VITRLANRFSKSTLESLLRTQERLKDKVQQLYESLNIEESFPELHNIDLDFVRLLLLARDLKINIRKRAIGSFFEWDRLDQAAGGRNQAIGSLSLCSFCLYSLTSYDRNQDSPEHSRRDCQMEAGPSQSHSKVQCVL
jgi:hypothetical protein